MEAQRGARPRPGQAASTEGPENEIGKRDPQLALPPAGKSSGPPQSQSPRNTNASIAYLNPPTIRISFLILRGGILNSMGTIATRRHTNKAQACYGSGTEVIEVRLCTRTPVSSGFGGNFLFRLPNFLCRVYHICVMRIFSRLKKQIGTFDLLGTYFRAVRLHFLDVSWGIGVGAGVPYMIWGIYSLFRTPPPAVNWLALFGALFLAGYYLWRADHMRLSVAVRVGNVQSQSWVHPAGEKTILYFFEIVNTSEAKSIQGVNVQLAGILPSTDEMNFLPIHLRQKHDWRFSTEALKTVDLNPGERKQIDLISGIVNGDWFEIQHIVSTVGNKITSKILHKLNVVISGKDIPASSVWFKVWAESGLIKCELDSIV